MKHLETGVRAIGVVVALVLSATSAGALWLNHPTPGLPRKADASPELVLALTHFFEHLGIGGQGYTPLVAPAGSSATRSAAAKTARPAARRAA
jgi:hypothetical protein